MITLEGYTIDNLLYESANSRVYSGVRTDDSRSVVIKLPASPHPAREQVARMRREYHLLEELKLEGTPVPVEMTSHGRSPVMVLSSFGGQSLMQLMVQRSFGLRRLLEAAVKVATILEEVHRAGIIHKDVSPGNIAWNPETGEVQIIDFGISSRLRMEAAEPVDEKVIRGTLAYMAPEQTGRMNRDIDYRADLYSLGATLFHLFTGRPPFGAADYLAHLHSHIAKAPPKVHEINDELPPVLSQIIDRLLAKTAEDRYQSAAAVAHDLQVCLDSIDASGKIAPFEIGTTDVVERFSIPQKLYGRELEVERLLESFERVAEGGRELVLVAGYSGVGKTRLVREVHRPITSRRGYFASGKFDQLQRNVPYSALISAFTQLIRHLLTLPADELALWRERILGAVGQNGAVIIDVIPDLAHLIGEQEAAPELGALEARNRFNLVFERFARAFAHEDHPVVVFLDDLQWADKPSLNLIGRFLTDENTAHLLVVGAYRDNEVDELHPLMLKLEDLHEEGATIEEIELAPLGRNDVSRMIADTLSVKPSEREVQQLSKVCYEKTEGNPFFLSRLLLEIYKDGALTFDREARRWTWKLNAIKGMQVEAGAVDLVLRRLEGLSARTRHMMRIAACLGARFDLQTLAIAGEIEMKAAAKALWPAVKEGLLVPIGENWQLLAHLEDDPEEAIEYRFLHDRVQQAAYALIPERERGEVHYQLGQRLSMYLDEESKDERIFEIVEHLNLAGDEIQDPAERMQLAQLNLKAATRARKAAAYEPALQLYQKGVECLGVSAWTDHSELIADLAVGAASAAYSSADFKTMDAYVQDVLNKTDDLLVKVRAHQILISARIAQNRPGDAIDVACEVLGLLDVELPRHADESAVPEWLGRTLEAMGDRDVHALAEAEEMSDPIKIAAMRIMASIASACYVAAPDIFPLVCFKQIELTAQYGVTSHTAFALTTFGIIQGGALGNLDVCYACGQAARRLLERLDAVEIEGRTRYVSNVYLDVWKTHVIDACENSVEIRDRCLETGDLEFAAWAAMMRTIYAFFLGIPLNDAEPEAAREVARIGSLKQDTALGYASISWQCMRNLAGMDGKGWELEGEAYKASKMLPQHTERGDHFAIASVHLHRLMLGVLFDQREQAREAAEALAPMLASIVSLHHVPTFFQFDALLALSDASELDADDPERQTLVERARADLEKLTFFAEHAPMNHKHRVKWLEAEFSALDGDTGSALEAFEKAVQLAAESGWGLDEAFIAERCAGFLRRSGNRTAQRAYAAEARYAWERIGARAKVDEITRIWPDTHWNAQPTMMDNRATRSFTTTSDRLDFRSILKSSQAISSEIRLDRLKHSLIQTVLENGGAERAVLILIESDGPRVEADSAVEGESPAEPVLVEDSDSLPTSVINYVIRSKSNVVLSDAVGSSRFEQDGYIARTQMRSILCAPMIRQGQVLGAIYLENSLVTGAFTLARIETLRALAAQAAIAIENAALYENLEDKVRQRTAELEVRNRFIKQTFGRYLSQEVVDNLLEDHSGLDLGGEQRKVTIMMADLRGFTSLSSRLSATEVVSILNTYLSAMTDIILGYQGTIDEFLGDAMLAIFGAPILREDDAERAIACAVAMQKAMEGVNAKLEEMGLPRVEMGIGLSTGEVVVGNIGSEKRAKYGVVGTAVNLAGRIESFTTGGQILISEATRNDCEVDLRVDAEIEMGAKGVREPVRILDVGGIGGNHGLYLPAPIIILHPLTEPYACRLAKQQGKHAIGSIERTRIVALGEREARVESANLQVHDDLRLWLAGDGEEPIYAKVIERPEHSEGEIVIRFTSVPSIARGRLAQLMQS